MKICREQKKILGSALIKILLNKYHVNCRLAPRQSYCCLISWPLLLWLKPVKISSKTTMLRFPHQSQWLQKICFLVVQSSFPSQKNCHHRIASFPPMSKSKTKWKIKWSTPANLQSNRAWRWGSRQSRWLNRNGKTNSVYKMAKVQPLPL